MNKLSYDFHIHSCLSPCADDDMTPSNIVAMSALKGLNAIALTDHNSCKNCPAFVSAAKPYNITAIPAMELTTSEEVHVLCYFPTLDNAMDFDSFIEKHIFKVPNREDIFGQQLIYDENDKIVRKENNLLINSTDISLSQVYDCLKPFKGLMVPAHIDKSSTSIFSNLGFIPPDSQFKAVEILHYDKLSEYLPLNRYLEKCKFLISSDAHKLDDINEPVNFLNISKDAAISDILNFLNT